MASLLTCKSWWIPLGPGHPDLPALYRIYDRIAVRVIQELIGKSAPKNEPNWPIARIHSVVGALGMRDAGPSYKELLRYVTLVHERQSPITEEDRFAPAVGEVLVKNETGSPIAGAASGSVNVYSGAAGSETDTGMDLTVYNRSSTSWATAKFGMAAHVNNAVYGVPYQT